VIDFPASPTLGQQFTAAGVTWTWDGTKWTASGLSVAYLPLTGGTLSGNLTVAPATGIGSISIAPVASTASLVLNRSANNFNSIIDFQSAGSPRWRLYLPTNEAETGGNAGSNFNLSSFGDNNAALPTNLVINRASGAATFGGNIIAPGISAPQAIGDNRIINGDMRIDQRNNGASGTATNAYTVDRWVYGATQAGKATWQRQPAAFTFPYTLNIVGISAYTPLATDFFGIYQAIEADMISDFRWGSASAQPVTLSFWFYAGVAGTFSGSIRNYASTRSYPFTFTVPTVSTWTQFVINIPGDTAGTWVMQGNVGALLVSFDFGSGANYRGPANAWAAANYVGVTGTANIIAVPNSVYLTGVKLEIGSVATPFPRLTMARALADCQRYFLQTILTCRFPSTGAGAYGNSFMMFPTTMRASPTSALVTAPTAISNVNSSAATPLSNVCARFELIATAAGDCYNLNPVYSFSAEL
jgi:hypothetical protein